MASVNNPYQIPETEADSPQFLPSNPSFAVVDIESTGLRPGEDEILQIAVVIQDWDHKIKGSWSSYVRPRQWLTRDLGPHHVHGIRRRQLLLAKSTSRAMEKFADLTSGKILVAHNASFDVSFLREAAERHGVPLRWAGILCTLNLSRQLDPQRQRTHKLGTLCEKYGVELVQAHDALHDATATAHLLPHLLSGNKITGAASAQPFFRS